MPKEIKFYCDACGVEIGITRCDGNVIYADGLTGKKSKVFLCKGCFNKALAWLHLPTEEAEQEQRKHGGK